jgi:hypothetical protein
MQHRFLDGLQEDNVDLGCNAHLLGHDPAQRKDRSKGHSVKVSKSTAAKPETKILSAVGACYNPHLYMLYCTHLLASGSSSASIDSWRTATMDKALRGAMTWGSTYLPAGGPGAAKHSDSGFSFSPGNLPHQPPPTSFLYWLGSA